MRVLQCFAFQVLCGRMQLWTGEAMKMNEIVISVSGRNGCTLSIVTGLSLLNYKLLATRLKLFPRIPLF